MTFEESEHERLSLAAFQGEVRSWLSANFPKALKGKKPSEHEEARPLTPDELSWRKAMGEKGWGTPTWPREYAGGGLSFAEARVLAEEMARAGAYNPIGGSGVSMFGPTLLEYGSEAQKRRHIPLIVRGEVSWCQGYSEPGAGSDLASLRTKAEDMGDHFLINGQKIWTSGAHLADWCFALVRTDTTRKQEGITFILIDMRSPGVDARPIRLISGGSYFCEIFFTDVRVPKDNVVGQVDGGWKIGKRLLQFERGGFSSPQGEQPKTNSLSALAIQRYISRDDDGRLADTDLRHRITKHEMDERAYLLTVDRVMTAGGPSDAASILKNVFSKLMQERDELTIEIMGMRGLGHSNEFFADVELKAATDFLFNKCLSIAGGTQEIQDNIISKRILGLPDPLRSAMS